MDFCTLFDSRYIDRALVMFDSLRETCEDAVLYVVAFDRKCSDVLFDLSLSGVVVIPYEEFEDDVLRAAKNDRSPREFFWTCSGYCIRYVMQRFGLDACTCIDSDLYFYESVTSAINRFLDSGCDAAIISHRYSRHPENDYNARMYGNYCVQFNTFRNSANGMAILNWWIDRCLERCPENATDGLFGDQKYLDDFSSRFDGVYVYEDFGLGVAPWNVDDYVQQDKLIVNRHTREQGKLLFYHFHSLDVSDDGSSNIRVFIRPGRHDRKLVEGLYRPYITRLIKKRRFLVERYGSFSGNAQSTFEKVHEGELRMFMKSELNQWFLIRKIWRYALNKSKDYINITV